MKTEYLFYGDTPDLDPYQFESAEGLLQSMIVRDNVLWAINFTSANANGEDDFVDGLNATCEIQDYEIYPYMDQRDQHLATAINYIENGTCQLPLADAKSGSHSSSATTLFHPVWQPEYQDIEHVSSE